jgi:hypothetical protein
MVAVALWVVVASGVLAVVVCDVVVGSSRCTASAISKTDRVAGGEVVCATATPAIISSAAPVASNMRFMIFSSTLDAAMEEASFRSNGMAAQAVAGSDYTHPAPRSQSWLRSAKLTTYQCRRRRAGLSSLIGAYCEPQKAPWDRGKADADLHSG